MHNVFMISKFLANFQQIKKFFLNLVEYIKLIFIFFLLLIY